MHIRYLSYGTSHTGGYRHEHCLYESAVRFFSERGEVRNEMCRKERLFRGPAAWVRMLYGAWKDAVADINIVPARLALPALIRNRRKGRVWIVLHNYDPNDGKSVWLTFYYRMLFRWLRSRNDERFRVICVAPFWLGYFKKTLRLPHVNYFPNLFDTAFYASFRTEHKNPWVHLGQFSTKNDPAIVNLAARLGRKGYYCYFSTLDPGVAMQGRGQFDILYFNDFRDYLEHMSRSCCTLALTLINEGWNRIAHESILVGTPVVGYARGGLGDLLRESDSIIVKNAEEAYTCITESLWVLPGQSFNDRYDIRNAGDYITPLCQP